MRVLLGEDDKAIAEVVTEILESNGYNVTHVLSSKELLSSLSQKPRLILLDISFADSDGANLAKKLKKNSLYSHIPIVFVSANSQIAEIARRTGVNDFLVKPFDIEDLLSIVKKYN